MPPPATSPVLGRVRVVSPWRMTAVTSSTSMSDGLADLTLDFTQELQLTADTDRLDLHGSPPDDTATSFSARGTVTVISASSR